MQRQLQSFLLGAVTAASLTLLSPGCSTPTTMTDVWRDPSFTTGPMRSLVVFGAHLDATRRRTLEDSFVAALSRHGVRGTASYTLFPDLPSADVARAQLQRYAADGYLIAAMRGISEQTSIVPGGYTGAFWGGYYGPGWGAVAYPSYTVTNNIVKFETSLWDSHGDGKLVWSAVTETENPSSGKDFMKSLLREVMPALTKAGLIPPEQGNAVSWMRARGE
jgi:hypothetical protein